MKIVNEKILIFLADIIVKYNLEKELVDETFNDIKESQTIERSFALFFNDIIEERVERGEKIEDFNPIVKLRLIIDFLINNDISYESLPSLIEKGLNVSSEVANEIFLLIEKNADIKELKDGFTFNDMPPGEDNHIDKKSIGYELLK